MLNQGANLQLTLEDDEPYIHSWPMQDPAGNTIGNAADLNIYFALVRNGRRGDGDLRRANE